MSEDLPLTYKSVDRRYPKPVPETVEEFLDMIRDHFQKNAAAQFDKINLGVCRNSCDNVIKPLYRERKSLRRTGHNAFRLCDEVKHRLERGLDDFTPEQWQAHNFFTSLVEDKSDRALLKRLGKVDAKAVSQDEMKLLIKTFSTIFFPTTPSDAQMEVDFKWEDWTNEPGLFGHYDHGSTGMPLICLSAFNHVRERSSYGNLNTSVMGRLSTLLHEIVHAYLAHYACHCMGLHKSYKESVGQLGGHGWAWQRIASSIERAAPDLIGLPIGLRRFQTIQTNWEEFAVWPTQQEVKDWKL